MGRIHNTSFSS
jgi:hypothetical protein